MVFSTKTSLINSSSIAPNSQVLARPRRTDTYFAVDSEVSWDRCLNVNLSTMTFTVTLLEQRHYAP